MPHQIPMTSPPLGVRPLPCSELPTRTRGDQDGAIFMVPSFHKALDTNEQSIGHIWKYSINVQYSQLCYSPSEDDLLISSPDPTKFPDIAPQRYIILWPWIANEPRLQDLTSGTLAFRILESKYIQIDESSNFGGKPKVAVPSSKSPRLPPFVASNSVSQMLTGTSSYATFDSINSRTMETISIWANFSEV